MRFAGLALLILLATVLGARPAYAHGMQSVSVDVTEVSEGKAVVHLRSATPVPGVRAVFAAPCTSSTADDDAEATMVECPGSLAGARVTLQGFGPTLTEAILIVSLRDGRRISRVLSADEPAFELPAVQTGAAVARGYVRLGVQHILTGYDHLLFLAALVLLLRRPRAVILAETAFTVSHSLSFSATALGIVRVSSAAAEAAIALSLVLVALDIGKDESAHVKRGAAIAFVFGLVHGLGFAGGLREIGLPEQHVALALLGFAGGVEIGQVAFLVLALLAVHLVTRRVPRARFEPALAAGIGGVAFFWLLQRTVLLFSGSA